MYSPPRRRSEASDARRQDARDDDARGDARATPLFLVRGADDQRRSLPRDGLPGSVEGAARVLGMRLDVRARIPLAALLLARMRRGVPRDGLRVRGLLAGRGIVTARVCSTHPARPAECWYRRIDGCKWCAHPGACELCGVEDAATVANCGWCAACFAASQLHARDVAETFGLVAADVNLIREYGLESVVTLPLDR